MLVQCAFVAVRTKESHLHAQFLRLKTRRGAKKAATAVEASILKAIYHMMRDGADYADLGPDHFFRHNKVRMAMHLVRRINNLGYDVGIKVAT